MLLPRIRELGLLPHGHALDTLARYHVRSRGNPKTLRTNRNKHTVRRSVYGKDISARYEPSDLSGLAAGTKPISADRFKANRSFCFGPDDSPRLPGGLGWEVHANR